MEKITAAKVLFIKLGEGGKFEAPCIEKDHTLRLGYGDVDHRLCVAGEWEKVHAYFTNVEHAKAGVATSHTNQVKQFYEEGEATLWITFYANKMWWCFSKPEITLLPDLTKSRPVIGTWSDKDVNGKVLSAGNISGKLLKTQGYRGTICSIPEEKYCLAKINGEQLPEVVAVEKAMLELTGTVSALIRHLHWKDFETLVDLIFRQAGWQRVSEIGKTQKTLDLDLLAPVTGERAIVQVKATSNLDEFKHYAEKFLAMREYDQLFYVVHSADKSLSTHQDYKEINLFFGDKIAELTISSGLVDWVIKKTT